MSKTMTHPTPSASIETGLLTRHENDRELSRAGAEATARSEMEAAVIMARRFPRDEERAVASLLKSCGRPTFAAECCYSYPRGDKEIEGPSVYLAREAARCWGNVQYGCDIVRDDEENRLIRGWAWDLETNLRVATEDSFAKLIYRKNGGWIKPDERDLRELTNRRAAILIRNCLLDILPFDLVEQAVLAAKKCLRKGAAANPDQARQAITKAFASIGVTVEALEQYLGHPLEKSSPVEVAGLRTVYKSLADGDSTWADYVPPDDRTTANGHASGADTDAGNAAGIDPGSLPGGFATDGRLSPFGVEINDAAGDPQLTTDGNALLIEQLHARRDELDADEFEFLNGKLAANADRLNRSRGQKDKSAASTEP